MSSNFDVSPRLEFTMARRARNDGRTWRADEQGVVVTKREVSVNRTVARAYQRALSARHRLSEASTKSGSSTRTTRSSDVAEGESSEASSSTRQDAVPSPEELSSLNRYLEYAPPMEILRWTVETYGGGLA